MKEAGKEVLNLLIAPFKEKITNPLFNSFVISFILLNWKAFYYLFFSTDTIDKKIINFEKIMNVWWINILIPILMVFFYNFLFPKFMNWFEKKTKKTKEERVDNKYDHKIKVESKEADLAKETYRKEAAKAGTDDIKRLSEEKSQLEKKINELDEKYKSLYDKNQETLKLYENEFKENSGKKQKLETYTKILNSSNNAVSNLNFNVTELIEKLDNKIDLNQIFSQDLKQIKYDKRQLNLLEGIRNGNYSFSEGDIDDIMHLYSLGLIFISVSINTENSISFTLQFNITQKGSIFYSHLFEN
ncbi:hypothetical protein [Aureivirga marina]|uniref:hypothetical protein n=1 Tax=Aureivirga marina TaxID=1182451 RepID=UPI0018CB4728|nr:hypothetical protein [Aureivirga marina]